MLRLLSLVCLMAVTMWGGVPTVVAADPSKPVPVPMPAPVAGVDPVDHDVDTFNPNVYSLDESGHGPKHVTRSPFTDPASDIARQVTSVTWFSSLVFLPFLVLPLLLLLYVIFKFRDTGDGRKPATFTGNHTLEIVWTVIPCVALVVVSFPTWFILDHMEAPPVHQKDRMAVRVTGKKFAWDYKYLGIYKDAKAEEKQEIAVGQFLGIQEPLVLAKGRAVELHMTSDDVNHAWWIPPFGVKKDCIKGRDTYAWFTPDTIGFFKGQCAELCGDGHGLMIITAVVVEKPDFARFIALQRVKDDTLKVWTAIDAKTVATLDTNPLPLAERLKNAQVAVQSAEAKAKQAGDAFAAAQVKAKQATDAYTAVQANAAKVVADLAASTKAVTDHTAAAAAATVQVAPLKAEADKQTAALGVTTNKATALVVTAPAYAAAAKAIQDAAAKAPLNPDLANAAKVAAATAQQQAGELAVAQKAMTDTAAVQKVAADKLAATMKLVTDNQLAAAEAQKKVVALTPMVKPAADAVVPAKAAADAANAAVVPVKAAADASAAELVAVKSQLDQLQPPAPKK